MAKTITVTKQVQAVSNYGGGREVYKVAVDGVGTGIYMPNQPLFNVVDNALAQVKEVIVQTGQVAQDVTVNTPVALDPTLVTFLNAKYGMEDQFNVITFA